MSSRSSGQSVIPFSCLPNCAHGSKSHDSVDRRIGEPHALGGFILNVLGLRIIVLGVNILGDRQLSQ